MSMYGVSHLLPSRCVCVEMHKPQCGGSELSNEWNLQLKIQSRRKGLQSICVLSFSGFTCATFLNEAQLCFVVLFSPLAVEPFNTQPQLHYIALSRSYKGSFSAWCLVLAGVFLSVVMAACSLTSLHRPAYHFETGVCCFKAAQVHNSLFTVETLPTTLSYLLWAGNSWASLVVKMGGCLPPKVRLMRHAWRSANVLCAAVFLVWIFFSGCEISFSIHFSCRRHLRGKWLTQWYLLNFCLVLLCLQNRQLQGLKGLFNKNPRHNSSENTCHYIRKRSIGDKILRRTASAPAKGRKKSKMGFQEMVEMKDSVSEAARDQDGVLRRTTRSLQARPASMPVDRSLLGALSLPVSETTKDTEGKENSQGKML